jgi:hypothetical protein
VARPPPPTRQCSWAHLCRLGSWARLLTAGPWTAGAADAQRAAAEDGRGRRGRERGREGPGWSSVQCHPSVATEAAAPPVAAPARRGTARRGTARVRPGRRDRSTLLWRCPPNTAAPSHYWNPYSPLTYLFQVPAQYRCPISQEVMEDPVATSDGHTYERREIFRWLCTHDTSPLTGARLPNRALTPAIALRQLIAAFVADNPTVET